ncbi:CTLH/CRA C-terminal to lish motif domain-domain-containing protein [Catenaria anguillulae PL171]|uniref:GID complex catalytic subunit 2 n=1 Tax=Catenaria anguillulae PL171 TaxID=765915 RepID=A0A1Y2I4K8_9FUNG|nr:CTLH/CRA C-terminal to lish motif domain-domain-containing protein [Catenaria anguillulae PL171]
MDAISPEFDKFAERHAKYLGDSAADTDSLLDLLASARSTLASTPAEDRKKHLVLLAAQVKSATARIIDDTKDVANALSKCGKAIDTKFASSAENEWQQDSFVGKQHILHRLIGEHFVREGHGALARKFQEEAGLDSLDTSDEHFQRLHHLIVALRNRNLAPCIEWAQEHRFDLNRIDSDLEFQLHKLTFLQHLQQSDRTLPPSKDPHIISAVAYAREHFGDFPERAKGNSNPTTSRRRRLVPPTANSLDPHNYSRFASATQWTDVERQFARDFCSLLGLSPDSPLFTTIMVGTTALPVLSRLFSKMKMTNADWTAMYELPVEVPLLPRHHFHSIFACPVTREQGTEQNPPMMLPCGHTISNESLKKLSRNLTARFKCPYCPCDAVASQALRVHL